MSYLGQVTKTLGLTLCLTGFALAHVSDGITRLYHGVQGDYEVWVTSRSSTPLVGAHHLSVTVLEASSKGTVPDAKVSLRVVAPGGHAKTYDVVRGTRAYSFELDVALERTGRYRLGLGVQSALGREEITFSLRLFTPLQLWLSLLAIIAALVSVMALLGFGKLELLKGGRSVAAQTLPAKEF